MKPSIALTGWCSFNWISINSKCRPSLSQSNSKIIILSSIRTTWLVYNHNLNRFQNESCQSIHSEALEARYRFALNSLFENWNKLSSILHHLWEGALSSELAPKSEVCEGAISIPCWNDAWYDFFLKKLKFLFFNFFTFFFYKNLHSQDERTMNETWTNEIK